MSYVTGRAGAGRLDGKRARPLTRSWAQTAASEQSPSQRSTSRGLIWGLALALTFWSLLAVAIWGF